MLTDQTIKFELRGLGALGCICTPATGYFYDKTKVSNENLRVDYYIPVLLKCLQKAMYLAFPCVDQIPTKVNCKMQDFKRVLA